VKIYRLTDRVQSRTIAKEIPMRYQENVVAYHPAQSQV
jgi:hypothetical protein